MAIKFKYFSDEKTASASISILNGELNDSQKEALEKEIGKQIRSLISEKKGKFAPSLPIEGLPEDITFEYMCDELPVNSRSISINMLWKGQTSNIFMNSEMPLPISSFKTIDASNNTKRSLEVKQLEWVDLYLKELNEVLKQILTNSTLDRAEKKGLEYSVEELTRSLMKNFEESTLFLFSAYLHFSIQQFSQTDKEKAGLFLLAARVLEDGNTTKNIMENDSGNFEQFFKDTKHGREN